MAKGIFSRMADIVKAIEMTVPGLVAHESAVKGGAWLDVPQFEW